MTKLYKTICQELETKTSTDHVGYFSGYASVFNTIDDYNDVIIQGAFQHSFHEVSSVKLLWQHDPKLPIGKFTNIYEDDYGLFVEGEIMLNIAAGREAFALIQAGAIDGLSIGYRIRESFVEDNIRVITDVELLEISAVTFPANKDAKITNPANDAEKIIDQILHEIEGDGGRY